MLLEGKKAIITGGTRGIGYAIACRFIEEGAAVTDVVRRELANGDDIALETLHPDGNVDLRDVPLVFAGYGISSALSGGYSLGSKNLVNTIAAIASMLSHMPTKQKPCPPVRISRARWRPGQSVCALRWASTKASS